MDSNRLRLSPQFSRILFDDKRARSSVRVSAHVFMDVMKVVSVCLATWDLISGNKITYTRKHYVIPWSRLTNEWEGCHPEFEEQTMLDLQVCRLQVEDEGRGYRPLELSLSDGRFEADRFGDQHWYGHYEEDSYDDYIENLVPSCEGRVSNYYELGRAFDEVLYSLDNETKAIIRKCHGTGAITLVGDCTLSHTFESGSKHERIIWWLLVLSLCEVLLLAIITPSRL